MKSLQFILIGFLLLILLGCRSISFTHTDSKINRVENSVDNTAVKVKPKLELKEFTLSVDKIKVKLPCDMSGNKQNTEDKPFGKKRTLIFNCNSGNLKFTFSSIKSDFTLVDEFNEIKQETGTIETRVNNLVALDNSKRTINTVTSSPAETTDSKWYFYTKNRVYKINEKWLVKLEIECKSNDEDYCEDMLFGKNQAETDELLNFIEIVK